MVVTGGAGFIGSSLSKALSSEGHKVLAIDDLSTGKPERLPGDVELLVQDVNSLESSQLGRQRVDHVIHLAGNSSGAYSYSYPVEDAKRNYESTVSISNICKELSIPKLIHASSVAVYGESLHKNNSLKEADNPSPLSNYGVSKLAAEKFLAIQNHVQSTSLRIFNTYGPGQDLSRLDQGMVSIYLAQALASSRIEVKGSLTRVRDFIYIDDVVEGILRTISLESAPHQILNLGTGIGTSVENLLEQIVQLAPAELKITDPTPADQDKTIADTEKLKKTLKWSPRTDLKSGLSIFARWAQENMDSFVSEEN